MEDMKREKNTITLEIDKAFKRELNKRSERMKLDPHTGFSWEETIYYLEEKVGRKIQFRSSLKMESE